jgi:hypothetical protein
MQRLVTSAASSAVVPVPHHLLNRFLWTAASHLLFLLLGQAFLAGLFFVLVARFVDLFIREFDAAILAQIQTTIGDMTIPNDVLPTSQVVLTPTVAAIAAVVSALQLRVVVIVVGRPTPVVRVVVHYSSSVGSAVSSL